MSDYEGEYDSLWHLEIGTPQEFKDLIGDLPIFKQKYLLELLVLLSTAYPEYSHAENFERASRFDGHPSGTQRQLDNHHGYY